MAQAGIPDADDMQQKYWGDELARAKKRYRTFWDNGDQVVDAYRLQKADGNDALSRDKYNILYSSTETIRPNLYAQQPKARVKLRSTDTATDTMRLAARLIEGNVLYVQEEEDLDETMDCVVEDFLLPGLGVAFVRYEPTFGDTPPDENGDVGQVLLDEMVKIDYIYWQDFLTGISRTWKEIPWVAKRLWLNKKRATDRFGSDKANKLTYAQREGQGREADTPTETAEVWEIWNKDNRTVYWYGEGLDELLDVKPDPLKLKAFFPCPRPLRAIANTRTFVPRSLYSQYKSQAETLNVLTRRIRLLGEALRVVGLYDGSQQKLADILNPAAGNKMIAVDSWAIFAQNGGINGAVQWLPIQEVATVLNEILKSREVCKQEIYEITGFSDVVRGVSKASETLGAQNLKADWAGARVRKMQMEVQRFVRDLLALAGELIAEHCSPETIAMFSGIPIPTPEEVQRSPDLQNKVKTFKDACDLIKNEMRRVSSLDIETDSILAADTEAEREDRAKFLAASGAFLQQAVPAMEATPELGPLLGALLMFTVRTFPSARPIEDEFEKVQAAMASRAAQQGQDQDKDGKKAQAQADAQKAQADAALKQQELAVRQAHEQSTAQNDAAAENNRHGEKMLELQLRQREMDLKEREFNANALIEAQNLKIAELDERTRRFTAIHAAGMAEIGLGQEAQQAEDDAELEYARLDDAKDDREATLEAQKAATSDDDA